MEARAALRNYTGLKPAPHAKIAGWHSDTSEKKYSDGIVCRALKIVIDYDVRMIQDR